MKNILSNLYDNYKQDKINKMLYMVIKDNNKYNVLTKNNYLLLDNKSILPSIKRIISNSSYISNKGSYYIYIETNTENLLKTKYENDDLMKHLNSLEDTIIVIFYKDKYCGSNYVKVYSNLSNKNFKDLFEINEEERESIFFSTSQIISSLANFEEFYYK
mgnify:FL=1